MAQRQCEGTQTRARSADELPVGRSPEGQLVRIDQAKAKGLACDLVCPACGGPLIAYLETTKKRQHFGHYSRGECRHGFETALHLYAKQLIEQRAELKLPAVIAASGKLLRPEQSTSFDAVLVEQRFHEIIPDITARRKDRHLLVEIAVTHPCEVRKLRILAQREVAAVEIDLSGYRTSTDPRTLDTVILESASRKWLFHPLIEKEDREAAALRHAEAARRAAEAEARIANERKRADETARRLMREFERWKRETTERRTDPAAEVPYYHDLELCGLEDLVDLDIPGQWILASSPKRWQSDVLWHLLIHPQESQRVLHGATVAKLLERKHYVRPEVREIESGVAAALRRIDPEMPDPITVGHAYIEALRVAQVLDETDRFSIEIIQPAFARRKAALDAARIAEEAKRKQQEHEAREVLKAEGRRREAERRTASRNRVDEELRRLLDQLPAQDRDAFDASTWWTTPLADGRTPERRVEVEHFTNKLADEIAALAQRQATHGAPAQDLLNLPLHEMRERRDREAAEHAAQAEVDQSNARLAAIESSGASEGWLETPMPDLDGLTPRLAALKSYRLYERAIALLHGNRPQRDYGLGDPRFATPNPEPYLRKLREAAKHCHGDRAALWLDTTSRGLGGIPSAICKDSGSLERCLDQLEVDVRKKLPAKFRDV